MADFCSGFAFERDVPSPSMLTIEGRQVNGFKTTKHGAAAELPCGERITAPCKDCTRKSLDRAVKALVRRYVTKTGALKDRKKARKTALDELGKGSAKWNEWRRKNPDQSPMLAAVKAGVHFAPRSLADYDFSYTNFTGAKLPGMNLRRANFHQAILAGADLSGAHLECANFAGRISTKRSLLRLI